MNRVFVLVVILGSLFLSISASAQDCLVEAQHVTQVSGQAHQAFLTEGENASFATVAAGCVAAVAVAPLHARLRLTLLADNGEALASSDEQANSAYVLRCGFEGQVHVFVELLRGAGEVHLASGEVAGSQRRAWEARTGACFSPAVGVSAVSLDVGPAPVPEPADVSRAIMQPWIRRGWEPVGTFRGSEVYVEASGCVRLFALPGTQLEVPRIRRRAASLAFCLDDEPNFEVRMSPADGGVVVLRRAQFSAPPQVPGALWSEALAQGSLARHVRVHGSGGDSWEQTLNFAHGCHRVVAFGRGAVLSVAGRGEGLRQRRVEGWSQVLFCGEGERRLKLRFFAGGSDVRLFVGEL
ncbi:MAG: hypothetical protein AB8H86_30280 [Polyangiales bacterium]